MVPHTSSHMTHKEKGPAVHVDSNTLETTLTRDQLDPALKAFLVIAKARYSSYKEVAQKFDDSQERFSSKMENFLKACSLTSEAALCAVHISQKQ